MISVYMDEDPVKAIFQFFSEEIPPCKERLIILTNQMHNEVT